MIAGVFIRNIKCYKGINFVPLVGSEKEKISIITGGNGVGKSTVLESINYIMNNVESSEWEITIDEKKDRGMVCPIFLIDAKHFKDDSKAKKISDVFWNTDLSKFYQHGEWVKDFSNWRDNLKKNLDIQSKCLITIGRTSKNDIIFTSTFHSLIENRKADGMSKTYFKDLFYNILDIYSYIYIPVNSSIREILSIQAREMQAMMDRKISEEIKNILESKGIQKHSIMESINKNLHEYIGELNSRFHDGYKYQPKGIKKNLSTFDVTKLVIREFFASRILTKNGKLITSLSSGQQRLALIDVATTMLSSGDKSKYIILSIDEPEASLEVSQRLKQFNRLSDLSNNYDHQCLLTTHWYGMLLKPFKGHLTHIKDETTPPVTTGFRLDTLFGKRSVIPDDIEIKGYFDFMSSLISTMKIHEENWIICEGIEDSIYLKCYLTKRIQNLNIIPFNGCGNIIKLFKFLEIPFQNQEEMKLIKGKILCLVDNDDKNITIEQSYKHSSYGQKLNFSRILLDRAKDQSSIISVANRNAINTEIEDILHVKPYTETVKYVSGLNYDISRDLAATLSHYNIEFENIIHSNTSRELGPFKPHNIEGYQNSEKLISLLNSPEIKYLVAENYSKFHDNYLEEIGEMGWVKSITSFFTTPEIELGKD